MLSGIIEGDAAKRMLRHAIDDSDVLRVSFSTSFEWFRALEMAGLYEETKQEMARWAALPKEGSTTCPETPTNSRSECHAWSALPIYELMVSMAGVRTQNRRVEIRPNLSYLPDLKGQAITPFGAVGFRYWKEDEIAHYEITLEENMEAALICADGRNIRLSGGTAIVTENI